MALPMRLLSFIRTLGPHKNPRKKGYKVVGRKHSKPPWNKGMKKNDKPVIDQNEIRT